MKRLSLFLSLCALLLLAAFGASAQDVGEIITLNDAVPAIDVVISLPPDTTGTVSLNFTQVSVSLTDSTGARVFYAADPRLHGVELNIAPNSGSHTLTVQRLDGATEAYVTVTALPEMTAAVGVTPVTGTNVSLNQEAVLNLDSGAPGGTLDLSIPVDTVGVVSASFPGAGATTQLTDEAGVLLVESFNGHVDGVNLVLDSGDYHLAVLGNGLTSPVVVGASVITAEAGGFSVLEAPTSAVTFAADTTTDTTVANCTATVQSSSINLRSGPGTGYTVLDYGYRNETYMVGGRNPENNWVLIATEDGQTAWISAGTAALDGSCADLTVFNVPLRNAQAAVIVTNPQQPVYTSGSDNSGSGSSNSGGEDEHEDEHEDEDEGNDD